MNGGCMRIGVDDLSRPAIHALLEEHLADMYATSPEDSVHALDVTALLVPTITVWTLWDGDDLLGCVALKEHTPGDGEVKSMRTAATARGQGVATRLLVHLLDEARRRGYARVSIETGPQDFFAAARRLYLRHGFVPCGPFANYRLDPHSLYLTLAL